MRAVIFDMDGLLVDSEPVWRRAEVAVLRPLGVPITEQLCALTTGLRADEVVHYWNVRHPWTSRSESDVVEELIATVESMLDEVESRPGAVRAVMDVRALGVPVALASSSSSRLIAAVLRGLDLAAAFDVVHSAEGEPFGKPHPAVYLGTASRLGVDPVQCVAVEDSINGLIAAKAARMACVAVPAPEDTRTELYSLADARLRSLEELPAALEQLTQG